MITGTPTGGNLSPLLFVIYINDICKYPFKGKLQAFADDLVLIYSCETWENVGEQMTYDLRALQKICAKKKLAMNLNKTKYALFALNESLNNASTHIKAHVPLCNSTDLSCSCEIVERVESLDYLGVTYQSNLKWDRQIEKINKSGRNFLQKLFYLRKLTPKYIQRGLYVSLFESRITYGLATWGGTFKTSLDPLKITQKFAIRLIENENRMAPSLPLFTRLGTKKPFYLRDI